MSRKSNANPYLSLVVVGRNDNYGGNFLTRFQRFLDNQARLWDAYGLHAELIVVEWNPPKDTPRFKSAFRFAPALKGRVRIIEVPREIHNVFAAQREYPPALFEYLGKNAAIRRARGEYVIATNPDLVYSDELVKYFSRRELRNGVLYRVDRCDYDPLVLDGNGHIDGQASRFVLRHNRFGSGYVPNEGWGRKVVRAATYLKNRITHFPYVPPYMNAAGDFALMAKKHWEELRGYAEVPHFTYPDALNFSGLALGLKEIALPYPIYHEEHLRGGIETGRPRSDYEMRKKEYRRMLRTGTPWIPNTEHWGLANYDLKEETII